MNKRTCGIVFHALAATVVVATALPQRGAGQPIAAPTAMEVDKMWQEARYLPGMRSELTEPMSTDGAITRLRKERYRCAIDEVKAWARGRQASDLHLPQEDELKCFTTRVLEAELALCQAPEDRVSAYSRALAYAKVNVGLNEIRFNHGRISTQDVQKARFDRLGIEIKLLEAKGDAAKARCR